MDLNYKNLKSKIKQTYFPTLNVSIFITDTTLTIELDKFELFHYNKSNQRFSSEYINIKHAFEMKDLFLGTIISDDTLYNQSDKSYRILESCPKCKSDNLIFKYAISIDDGVYQCNNGHAIGTTYETK
jgi:hypothetical protein